MPHARTRRARPGLRSAPRSDRTTGGLRCGGATRVVDISVEDDRELIAEPGVTWGLAEFVAAEEMDRQRGFWWSPTATRCWRRGSTIRLCSNGTSATRRTPTGRRPSFLSGRRHRECRRVVVVVPARWPRNDVAGIAPIPLSGSGGGAPVSPRCCSSRRAISARCGSATSTSTPARPLSFAATPAHWLERSPGRPTGYLMAGSSHATSTTRGGSWSATSWSHPVPQVPAVLASHGSVLFSASTEPTEQQLWANSTASAWP